MPRRVTREIRLGYVVEYLSGRRWIVNLHNCYARTVNEAIARYDSTINHGFAEQQKNGTARVVPVSIRRPLIRKAKGSTYVHPSNR